MWRKKKRKKREERKCYVYKMNLIVKHTKKHAETDKKAH